MVNTTATVTRTGGLIVQCNLRLNNRIDKTDVSGGGAGNQDMALGISGGSPAGGSAQLRCADGTATATDGRVSNIEIQALKVPKLTVTSVP